MQRLAGPARRCHQQPDLGECRLDVVPARRQRLFHVPQVRATVARLVPRDEVVDLLDHRFRVPLPGATVPVVQADLAAEMHHQRLQGRRRVKRKPHRVEFLFSRRQVRPEATQVFDQHQGVLLLLEEPDRHERREIAVLAVVAQEHLGGRQRRPFRDRVHLDRQGLLVRELPGVEIRPGDIVVQVPPDALECLEQFGVEHLHCHGRSWVQTA